MSLQLHSQKNLKATEQFWGGKKKQKQGQQPAQPQGLTHRGATGFLFFFLEVPR